MRSAEFLARLHALGLARVRRCVLTRNQSTMVSYRGEVLRVQEAFAVAPDEVVRAIVAFVQGRGAARRAARQVILAWPVPRDASRARRSEGTHPDDVPTVERLRAEHARLNRTHFEGALGDIDIRVSRRMRRKLGHYASASAGRAASIAISRRHLRRHGWAGATHTLLHEMVHQWQAETGRRLGHGPEFWRKAAEVGAVDATPEHHERPRTERRRPVQLGLWQAIVERLGALR